jgi:hypothetical protein
VAEVVDVVSLELFELKSKSAVQNFRRVSTLFTMLCSVEALVEGRCQREDLVQFRCDNAVRRSKGCEGIARRTRGVVRSRSSEGICSCYGG